MGLPSVLTIVCSLTLSLCAAQNCDCSHFPITPKSCETKCTQSRLDAATAFVSALRDNPEDGMPGDLLRRAKCLVVAPGAEGAGFIAGADVLHGFAACRTDLSGEWTAPAAIRIEGGSHQFSIGRSPTDVFLVVLNQRGVSSLTDSKFRLGADASVAAGPVGRNASADTDAMRSASMLSYSRTRGVFSGMSLQGASITEDDAVNRAIYGRSVTNKEILAGKVPSPPGAVSFEKALRTAIR